MVSPRDVEEDKRGTFYENYVICQTYRGVSSVTSMICWRMRISVGLILTQTGCVMVSEMWFVIVTCQTFTWKAISLLGSNTEALMMLLKNGLTGPWQTLYGWHAIRM
jgi:hypothetical protein